MPKQSLSKIKRSTVERKMLLPTQAHILQQKIKALCCKSLDMVFEIGEKLIKFKEGRGHTALGYTNWDEWVSQPEIGLGRTTAYIYMRAARLKPKIQLLPSLLREGLSYKKLIIILAILDKTEDPDEIESILYQASSNSTSDLKALYGPPELYGTAMMGVESEDKFNFIEAKHNYTASAESQWKMFAGKKVKYSIRLVENGEESDNPH